MPSGHAPVRAVATVICQTSNMDRSVGFYRDVLGLAPGHVTPYWSEFAVGGVRIGIHPPYQGSMPPFSEPNKGWVLGLEVEDLPAFRERVEAAGVDFVGDYHEVPGGVIFDFRDPDGHALQACQYGISAKDLS